MGNVSQMSNADVERNVWSLIIALKEQNALHLLTYPNFARDQELTTILEAYKTGLIDELEMETILRKWVVS
jgi:hypothetical protein